MTLEQQGQAQVRPKDEGKDNRRDAAGDEAQAQRTGSFDWLRKQITEAARVRIRSMPSFRRNRVDQDLEGVGVPGIIAGRLYFRELGRIRRDPFGGANRRGPIFQRRHVDRDAVTLTRIWRASMARAPAQHGRSPAGRTAQMERWRASNSSSRNGFGR